MSSDAGPTRVQVRADIYQANVDGTEEREFPHGESECRIILAKRVVEAIGRQGERDADLESCGVLVGQVCRDKVGPFVVVSDIIQGKHARQDASRVSFTHSTWEYIHNEMDRVHGTSRIVGWYHTHPGFGVFLSEVDLFAQRHFFDVPWQVAVVMDTKAGKCGCFYWQGGEMARARRFWVDGQEVWEPAERPVVGSPPGVETRRRGDANPQDAAPAARAPAWPDRVPLGIVGALLCVALVVALCIIVRLDSENRRMKREATITRDAEAAASPVRESHAGQNQNQP